ncbi:hypothetical protein [Teredinibacter sp. KSP-S5-2]|uniref:hypothetical protein n=1 Tax=Teredinibacter sp. KSP-S5-2 TaxID=3034506 RepID=UPI002934E2AC|nr:hypothetical protein [Teredinibacter sp. KSP-S5-2]WNO07858.1 hypothetical protein P5V12_12790 [Teredinibacter sp. KSP-S5-2]
MSSVLIVRILATGGIQILKLVTFLLLLKALSSREFEYFYSTLSLLSIVQLHAIGFPVYAKDLYLKRKLELDSLKLGLCTISLMIVILSFLLLSFVEREFPYLAVVALLLFVMRVVAGYVELFLNVTHQYGKSLVFSFCVELIFLFFVLKVKSWSDIPGFFFGYSYFVALLICLYFCAVWVLVHVLRKFPVFLDNIWNLAKFSVIEVSSVIAFGLDLFFASIVFDDSGFIVYATIVRLFSPIPQFQGMVSRYLWAAGYNRNLGWASLNYQSLISTLISVVGLILSVLLAKYIFGWFDIEVDLVDNIPLVVVVCLTYFFIVLSRHAKNLANSRGITHQIWMPYSIGVSLFAVVPVILYFIEFDGAELVYLIARALLFGWISLFIFNLVRNNNEKNSGEKAIS